MLEIKMKAIEINDNLAIFSLDGIIDFLSNIQESNIIEENGIERIYFENPRFKDSQTVFNFIKDTLFLTTKSLEIKKCCGYFQALGNKILNCLDFITINEENTSYTVLQAQDIRAMINCIIENIKTNPDLKLLIPQKIETAA